MKTIEFVVRLDAQCRRRHKHTHFRNKVISFTVQLEVRVKDKWRPVIRYDTAHGFAHIDRYNLRGRTKKERLALNYGEALTRAERDIKKPDHRKSIVFRPDFEIGGGHGGWISSFNLQPLSFQPASCDSCSCWIDHLFL